jgi:hypothetical protein
MSEFKGGNKVRCVDCTKLSGKTCTAKNTSVSIKKRRSCGQYNFSGEFVNNTPLPSTYLPHVDKKTKQLMRKLQKMGVMPMQTGPRPTPAPADGPYGEEAAPINPAAFQSTATAAIPIVKPLESVGEAASAAPLKIGQGGDPTSTVVWSPEDAVDVDE